MKNLLLIALLMVSSFGVSQITINKDMETIAYSQKLGFKVATVQNDGETYRITFAKEAGLNKPSIEDGFEFNFKATKREYNQFCREVVKAIENKDDLSVTLNGVDFRLKNTLLSVIVEQVKNDKVINKSVAFSRKQLSDLFDVN